MTDQQTEQKPDDSTASNSTPLLSGWISVDERLPPEGTWVIAATYYTWSGGVEKLTGKKPSQLVTELFFDGGLDGTQQYWLKDGDWDMPVTDWMPLPEPPAR